MARINAGRWTGAALAFVLCALAAWWFGKGRVAIPFCVLSISCCGTSTAMLIRRDMHAARVDREKK